MLVWVQFDALLLDTWRTSSHRYFSKCHSKLNFKNFSGNFANTSRFFQTNFVFLLNIIRVLVVKLRQRHTSDIEQVRKAVRAAFVLLPLLGITNLLNMAEAPLDGSPQLFASWSFITHFLTSFQGFFVAMIYCFLNGEVWNYISNLNHTFPKLFRILLSSHLTNQVRVAIMKSISVYMSLRGHHDWAMRRTSFFSGNYPTNAEVVQQLPIPTGIGENR